MTQAQILIQGFFLIAASGVCRDTPIKDWVKILLFTHKKGFLYCSHNDNDKIEMIVCMYRIPNLSKKCLNTYPEKEEGNILYIPFFASRMKEELSANRLLKRYLDQHPEIKKIAFYDERKDGNKLRTFDRIKQEA